MSLPGVRSGNRSFALATVAVSFLFCTICSTPAQVPAPDAAMSSYQLLRNPSLGTEAFVVDELVLRRDAAVFNLHSGTICLLAPVDGVVTGAVFTGKGSLTLETDSAMESSQIKLLTNDPDLHEEFEKLVVRFSDHTADELRNSRSLRPTSTAGCKDNLLDGVGKRLRSPIRYNLAARLLQDVLAKDANGVFYAFIDGNKYSNRMLFVIDPHGIPELLLPSIRAGVPPISVSPEEVALFTYDERHFGVWYARHLLPEYAAGTATGTQQNEFIQPVTHTLDVSIETSGRLSGTDSCTIRSSVADLYVVPFDLFDSLRVESVTDAAGQAVGFIQEDKDQDPQFSVILRKPLQKGETVTLTTRYSGKDVVFNKGNDNFYPLARTNWYPNTRLGDRADYTLTLRVPKGLTTLATGKLVSQTVEGNRSVSKWQTEIPIAVAGFNLGGFREKSGKLQGADLVVAVYANTDQDRFHSSEDSIVPIAGLQRVFEEGMAASAIYTNIFGPVPFGHVALTQQTAPNYGQAWPELIYLPITSFLTTQIEFGNGPLGRWLQSVVPHEVAHQWWGHMVGWNSYRDQWMSEGFSEFSASVYVQITWGEEDYLQFWKGERTLLTDRTAEGYRAIDVGPLAMGYRLATARTGYQTYRRLIYPKGAFVVHMLRMMLWTPQEKDKVFSALMQDFLKTYRGQAASTEDFQRVTEKHMTPGTDLAHNRKMDWFFDEWVRGTELPTYGFSYTLDKNKEGKIVLGWFLRQSGVSDDFQMPVPIYLELANKQFAKLVLVNMRGNSNREGKMVLGNLETMPKRALINYQYDVLSAP